MNIHEYQGKSLLKGFGVAIQEGIVADTPEQAVEAAKQLNELNISCELIDVQTLLPFDINHMIVNSLKKTNKVIFIDEDVSGGATAYMMDQVLNTQKGYFHLDAQPVTLTAKDHRPAYGSDGDYFSKPSIDDIIENIYEIMAEYDPKKYPSII